MKCVTLFLLLIPNMVCAEMVVKYSEHVKKEREVKAVAVTKGPGEHGPGVKTVFLSRSARVESKENTNKYTAIASYQDEGWVAESSVSDRVVLLSVHDVKVDSFGVMSWILIKKGVISVIRSEINQGKVTLFQYKLALKSEDDSDNIWNGGDLSIVSINENEAVVSEAANVRAFAFNQKIITNKIVVEKASNTEGKVVKVPGSYASNARVLIFRK